jgi:hypothetical protein
MNKNIIDNPGYNDKLTGALGQFATRVFFGDDIPELVR